MTFSAPLWLLGLLPWAAVALYLLGSSRYPYIPEMGAGGFPWGPPFREADSVATTLAALGCASGQGFYFARPLAPEHALDYWQSRRRAGRLPGPLR